MTYGAAIIVSVLAIIGAGQVLFWIVDGAHNLQQRRLERRYRNMWRKGEFPRADIRTAQRPRK